MAVCAFSAIFPRFPTDFARLENDIDYGGADSSAIPIFKLRTDFVLKF